MTSIIASWSEAWEHYFHSDAAAAVATEQSVGVEKEENARKALSLPFTRDVQYTTPPAISETLDKVSAPTIRPKIAAPDYQSNPNPKKVIDEMDALFKGVKHEKADALLLKLIFQAITEQRELRSQAGANAQESIMKGHEKLKTHRKEKAELDEKYSGSNKIASTAGWISSLLGLGALTKSVYSMASCLWAGIAAPAFTFTTANVSALVAEAFAAVSAPALAGMAATILVFGQFISLTTKKYYEMKTSEYSGDLYGLKVKREEIHKKLSKDISNAEKALEKMLDYYRQQREMLTNAYQAARYTK